MTVPRLVLDTSLFVNPAASRAFGANPTEAFIRFLEFARETDGVEYLMPPSAYAELMHFAEEARVPKALLNVLRLTPPRKHETKLPAIFLYTFVEDMRDRVDRGLRLAERHVREALQAAPPAASPAVPAEKGPRADAEIIGRLRESYRRMLREGTLDSRVDVDLLVLAYETGAFLATADLGAVEWANNLGITVVPHDRVKEFLDEHRRREKNVR